MIRSVRTALPVAAVAAALIVAGVTAAPKQPRIQTGPNAEVSAEGLVRVDKSVVDAAWVKPDFDLTPYKKLMIASAGVSYKKIKPFSGTPFGNKSGRQSEFPVTEQGKARFDKILKEEFIKSLSELERYRIVDQAGPDVLLLVGGVIDVESNVPPYLNSPSFAGGTSGVYMSSIGEATLIIELRDSQSNEVLGRAADRRAADSPFAFDANGPTGWSKVQQLAQSWASLLRKRLEEIEKI